MRKEILEQMSDAEIVEYARALGISSKELKKANNKATFIYDRWEREVEISVFGETFKVKAKTVKDKRFVDIVTSKNPTDEQMMEALLVLLGEEQTQKLYELCTDEDGTVDISAVALGFVSIVNNSELKN
jgi:hypothetical protein